MIKTAMVIGFIGIVIGLLYMAWVKVLKPLHSVSKDSALREGLVEILQKNVMWVVKRVPAYREESRKEIILANRLKVEAASDKLFEQIVKLMSSEPEWKNRFYTDTGPGLGVWLESHLWDQLVELPDVEGDTVLDDGVFNAVVECYIEFSKFATNHPDAVEWTAFGFMSWVNLNIDQVLEDLMSECV